MKKVDAELGHLSAFGLDMFFSCPVINRALINLLYVWILFWNASVFFCLFCFLFCFLLLLFFEKRQDTECFLKESALADWQRLRPIPHFTDFCVQGMSEQLLVKLTK